MPLDRGDPALDTLLLPFANGQLTWPETGGALFLRARAGAALQAVARPGLVCVQSFKPEADALTQAGFTLLPGEEVAGARYPLVLVLPPRQRQEARALLARAMSCCAPGGIVVACMANDEGARSGESDLQQLAPLAGSVSKHHCRVYWANTAGVPPDSALLDAWRSADAPRPILDGRYTSRPGLFAWDRIDPASALLAQHLPTTLSGAAADLGCGFGYLSDELLRRCPGITSLDLYEAERRALDLAQMNLSQHAQSAALGFHWHDVPAGLPQRYDLIVTNPPFHAQGAVDRPDIGRAFIAAAASALRPGGRLWMVANRQLPYESILGAHFASARSVTQVAGFKIIEAVKEGRVRS